MTADEIAEIVYQYHRDCNLQKGRWDSLMRDMCWTKEKRKTTSFAEGSKEIIQKSVDRVKKAVADEEDDLPLVKTLLSAGNYRLRQVVDIRDEFARATHRFQADMEKVLASYLPADDDAFYAKIKELIEHTSVKPLPWLHSSYGSNQIFPPDKSERELMQHMLKEVQAVAEEMKKNIGQLQKKSQEWNTSDLIVNKEKLLQEIIQLMLALPAPPGKAPAWVDKLPNLEKLRESIISAMLKQNLEENKIEKEKSTRLNNDSLSKQQIKDNNMLKKFLGIPADKKMDEVINILIVLKEAKKWIATQGSEGKEGLDKIIEKMLAMLASTGKPPLWLAQIQDKRLRNAIADRIVEQSKASTEDAPLHLDKVLHERTMLQKWLKTPTTHGSSRGLMTRLAGSFSLFEGHTRSYKKLQSASNSNFRLKLARK